MRLLRIIDSMDPSHGGPSQGIRNMHDSMKALHVETDIVSLDPPGAAFLLNHPIPVNAIGPGIGRWKYSKNLRPWLDAHIQAYDVIIIHGLWLYAGYAAWNAYRQVTHLPRAPLFFVMAHGMLDPYFQTEPSRIVKAIRNILYWKLIESKVVNGASGILFTCQTELLLARTTFTPYAPKRELNIGYGIKEPPLYETVLETKALDNPSVDLSLPFILFLGRIHPKKGLDLLLEAYRQCLAAETDHNRRIPRLVIAGPGLETDFGTGLQAQVSKSELLKRAVTFEGMLIGAIKWAAMYRCQAFILPSHQENFGIAVAEALACGKPVLITDAVNIWREVAEADAGLIAPDTLNGIRSLLERWLELDENKKSQMSKNARLAFEKNFQVLPVAKKLLAEIKSYKK